MNRVLIGFGSRPKSNDLVFIPSQFTECPVGAPRCEQTDPTGRWCVSCHGGMPVNNYLKPQVTFAELQQMKIPLLFTSRDFTESLESPLRQSLQALREAVATFRQTTSTDVVQAQADLTRLQSILTSKK